ncbi:DUF1707 domain-containing protein [Mycobacterium scrofulaceum]|uniref:Uncharacterized protein n=1 Tax=Mycobacterium scrofulaceum TaxID=1783 RepID=A0A1A2VJG6_MYCSC|nr:DUF1707 domain-containing protein [Mycobacterium scrofulaceum]OBH84002.1 hypothetical protein A5681_20125 [Mycobacterium scrofulaceum]OBI00985.1 hypothetical protein A5679_18990 [Mycobacterium scrofulaceum]
MDQQLTTPRAGDRDRERAAARLGQALAQGYLDLAEYEQRVQAVFGAHSTGELRELLADLPIERIRRADPRRRAARVEAARRSVRIHLGAYLLMTVIVLTVWAAVAATTGEMYFWPIWPILGAGIGLVSHALGIHPAVKTVAK